jgi:ketosteroid isomerase-like protein
MTGLATPLMRRHPVLSPAMSEESVRIVGEALAALGTLGPAAFAEHLTDDVHYRAIEGAPDDRGPMHGRDAVRAYFQDWLDTFDEMSARVVELIDAGDETVIALLEVSGRARLSGIETDVTFAIRYDIRDGKIARGRESATRAEAIAQE